MTAKTATKQVHISQREFWRNTTPAPGGCIVWTGYVSKDGYGITRIGGFNVRAHRVAYAIHYGKIPDGLAICHRCDVRHCCNPDHLFLGTTAENNQDMQRKGRLVTPKGEGHGRSRLTLEQVNDIRKRAVPGQYSALGREFGVSGVQILRIVKGQQWTA